MAYATPGVAELVTRYPAFAAVPPATIASYIATADTDAADASWPETSRAPAVLAYAAHSMALLGIGDHGEIASYARQGVTSVRSGSFGATLDASAANGELGSTPYGREYKRLLGAAKGGPLVISGPALLGGSFPFRRQNDGVIIP